MDENVKKRKATSHHVLIPKRKFVTKTKESPKIVINRKNISDEDSPLKSRTPSGTEITVNVSDIRSFFSPKNKIRRSKKAVKENKISIRKKKPAKRNALIKPTPGDDASHASIGALQNTSSDKVSTTDSEGYFTPHLTYSFESDKEKEDEFLLQLASLIKPATEEQLSGSALKRKCEMQSNVTSKDNQQASSNIKNTMEQKTLIQSLQVSEDTTEENPQSMSVVHVMEMLNDIKLEFARKNDETIQTIKEQVQTSIF